MLFLNGVLLGHILNQLVYVLDVVMSFFVPRY